MKGSGSSGISATLSMAACSFASMLLEVGLHCLGRERSRLVAVGGAAGAAAASAASSLLSPSYSAAMVSPP